MNTLRGPLSDEDLARWRRNQAAIEAMRVKPDWYTREEVERLFIEQWRLIADFTDTYNIDGAKVITFSRTTGAIFESIKDYDPAGS